MSIDDTGPIDSLADTDVSFKLDEIRRRCDQLMSDPDALELALEEPVGQPDGTNPYDLGRLPPARAKACEVAHQRKREAGSVVRRKPRHTGRS